MTFADTSFFVGLVLRRDSRHLSARKLLETQAGSRMVTTNLIRGETWTVLRRRDSHRTAVSFLDYLDKSKHFAVEWVDEELDEIARAWLRRRDEREYSFVDAASFAFMRANGISAALAFDGDFAAAGFVELRP